MHNWNNTLHCLVHRGAVDNSIQKLTVDIIKIAAVATTVAAAVVAVVASLFVSAGDYHHYHCQ